MRYITAVLYMMAVAQSVEEGGYVANGYLSSALKGLWHVPYQSTFHVLSPMWLELISVQSPNRLN